MRVSAWSDCMKVNVDTLRGFNNKMAQNGLTPFYLETSSVRGRMVRLQTLTKEIIQRHTYPTLINHYLTELITLGVLLSNTFKLDGIFTLHVQGAKDAPISFLVVDIDSKNNVRACANFKEESLTSWTQDPPTLPELFGEGYLAFTIDQETQTERYQGIVELQGATLRDCLQHYFRQSEQLETAFYLTVNENFEACGIMLQKLPFDAENDGQAYDQWVTAVSLLSTLKAKEALTLAPYEVLKRLFWQEGLQVFEEKELHFRCRCKREKIESFLKSLPFEEKQSLAKNGMIYVSCDYCSEMYTFEVGSLNQENSVL